MKRLITLTGMIVLLLLTGCGGGGGGGIGGGSGGGTSVSSIGTVYGVSENSDYTGNIVATSVSASGTQVSSSTRSSATGTYPKQTATATVGGTTYFYVVVNGTNTVDEFSVSGTTVTSIGSVPTGTSPQCITVVNNKYVFVGDTNGGTTGAGDIYSYQINGNGTLTAVGTPAYNAGNPVYGMSVDATGTYLVAGVVTSGSTWDADVLTINSGGTLTYDSTSASVSGAGVPFFWTVDPSTTNGDFMFSSAWNGNYYYEAKLSGSSITITTVTGTSNHNQAPVWVDPSGTWLYMNDYNYSTYVSNLVQYSIGSSGTLTQTGTPIELASTGGISDSPASYVSSGGYLVVGAGGVGVISYNSLNGAMTLQGFLSGIIPTGYMAFAQ